MSELSIIAAFTQEADSVKSVQELENLIDQTTRELGFDFYTLVHHVDLANLPDDAVAMSNYPKSWIEMQIQNKFFVEDPVHLASQRHGSGFLWSELGTLISLTSRHKKILDLAQKQGLGEGYSIPVHLPGDASGSSSFGMKIGRTFPEKMRPVAQLFGTYAFEATRRLARRMYGREGHDRRQLSPRQLECLIWVGRGKTDSETASIMGISPETVKKHIDQVKIRYEMNSRSQLVAQALYRSEVTFGDLLGNRYYTRTTRNRV